MTYVGAVRAALAEVGDPERAAQQQAYMKSDLPYVGLGAPALKALLRPILAEHRFADRAQWEAAALELFEDATHREEWYAAVALLRHRSYRPWLDPDLLPLLEDLVRLGAWWDVVDEIAGHLVGQVLLDHRDGGDAGDGRVGRSTPTACGCGAPRCWRSCGTPRPPTPTCSSGCWSPTSTTRRTARSSSSARRSAGRCGSTPGRTRRGSGPSSGPTPTG